MKKVPQGSYMKQFKSRIESKEIKAKNSDKERIKGIDFDTLQDWDTIVNESENNNQSIHNNKELRVEDIYNPAVRQVNYLKENLIGNEADDYNAVLPLKNHNNNNQYDALNEYSVNTSGFTYKQNEFDRIDLSTVNSDNINSHSNNVIIGKRVPIAFCENMVSQIKKSSPEHYGITPAVIKEEDEDDENKNNTNDDYRNNNVVNEEDSLNEDNGNVDGNVSDIITNRINDDDDSNDITIKQMKELDEEMNKMHYDMKVKNFQEKIADKKGKQGQGKQGQGKQIKQKCITTPTTTAITINNGNNELIQGQKLNKKIQKESALLTGEETGKFGGVISNTLNTCVNSNNININPIPYQYQDYPATYIQQMQQMGTFRPQIYQDINTYPNPNPQFIPQQQPQPVNYSPYNQYQYNQYQMPMNINITPIQIQQNGINPNDQQTLSQQQPNKPKAMPQYRPKTMKEYKQKYNDVANKKLGGLGPNIGTKEWDEKHQKVNKIKQYSSQIKETNKEKKATLPNLKINSQLNIPPYALINTNVNTDNKQQNELKNQLLHDSLSEDEFKSLDDIMDNTNNTNENYNNNSNKKNLSDNLINPPIQSEKISVQSAKGGHANFIKSLKLNNQQSKDANVINLSNYKKVAMKSSSPPPLTNNNKNNHSKIYTTMKQPNGNLRRNKSLDPTKRHISKNNPRPKSSLSKPKVFNNKAIPEANDDELTQKFMQMPSNNLIENLLQNHQAYNTQVNKIRTYLDNK